MQKGAQGKNAKRRTKMLKCKKAVRPYCRDFRAVRSQLKLGWFHISILRRCIPRDNHSAGPSEIRLDEARPSSKIRRRKQLSRLAVRRPDVVLIDFLGGVMLCFWRKSREAVRRFFLSINKLFAKVYEQVIAFTQEREKEKRKEKE